MPSGVRIPPTPLDTDARHHHHDEDLLATPSAQVRGQGADQRHMPPVTETQPLPSEASPTSVLLVEDDRATAALLLWCKVLRDELNETTYSTDLKIKCHENFPRGAPTWKNLISFKHLAVASGHVVHRKRVLAKNHRSDGYAYRVEEWS